MSGESTPPLTLVERLGRGSTFEVSRVVDASGLALILKRPADPSSHHGNRALDREREILVAGRGQSLPRFVASGSDRHGFFLLETRAPGIPIRCLERARPLRAPDWLSLAQSLSSALSRIHALEDGRGGLQLVHGDISPDNLFVAPAGRVTFVDWSVGLWRDGPTSVFPTARGTLPYAPPEVAREESRPDDRADVYSMAAVLLWLAVERVLDAETEAARLAEVGSRGLCTDAIRRRNDLPLFARNVIVDALQFDPNERSIRSARDLAARLTPE